MADLPSGTVTFLFTDIEGSTNIAQTYPEAWESLRGRHHEILRNAIQAHNGFVFQIVGDEFCAAFFTASDALKAALAAQQGLQTENWQPTAVKVRMGINTGSAQVGNVNDPSGGYTGYAALARVNRVMSAGYGGQILLSNSSADLARGDLPSTVSLRDMGEQRLKGLLSPEHLWQAEAPGLMSDFPPLKTLGAVIVSVPAQLTAFMGREKEILAGLDKFEAELPQRAPVLMEGFQKHARRLRLSLRTPASSLSEQAYKERFDALSEVNKMCAKTLDITFIGLCLGEVPPAYDERCPFRGLESFRPEDKEFFFGRDALIKKLLGKFKSHSFLAVLGMSGSGKSSLVMAGLVPVLGLDYAVFRPGVDPLAELESALEAVGEGGLLVVDQFEETFTLSNDEIRRKEFIAKLLEAMKRYKVVITLRSDFLGEVATYRALKEEVQNHMEIVPPMDEDELYQVMEGQAESVGLRFEADLGQQILNDVEGEPGAMPLLQHALWMLWKRRHGLWLMTREYQDFGGIRQAIASTAEDVYGLCNEMDQGRMRDIFLRLTHLGEGMDGRDTRRRILLTDLIPAGQGFSPTTLLLDRLANARLIVKTVSGDQTQVEVAHEALIRHWERLQGWLNEDRDKLRLREGVSEFAKEWDKAKRDESLLNHRGGRLEDALLFRQDARYGLTALEQEYLNECAALRQREQLARERRQRWTVIASVTAAVIFLILGAFGLVKSQEASAQASAAQANANVASTERANADSARATAVFNEQEALHQAQIALAHQLSAQAQNLNLTLNSKQPLAFLLAIQSAKLSPSAEAFQVLLGRNLAARPVSSVAHAERVYAVAFSPDGGSFASGSWDNTLRVWEASTGQEISRMTHEDRLYSIAFSPNGRYLVSGSKDNTSRVWEAATGREVARMTHEDRVYSVAFSPEDRYVISGSADGTARVWEAATGREISRMTHTDRVYTVSFSPDGKYVVSGSYDFTACVWEADTGKVSACVIHDDLVYAAAFSPDGKYVVSGSSDGTARVWEAATGREISRMTHDDAVGLAAFSPDGNYVVSGSYGTWDYTARVWEAATGREISRTTHDNIVYSVAFSPDGKYVASGSVDGTARVWEAATAREVARMTHDDTVYSVAFSPNGNYVVSGSLDKTARVWEVATGDAVRYILFDNTACSSAFSSDGRYVAAGSTDHTIHIFDVGTGEEIARLAHEDAACPFAFSPDSKYIATGGNDDTARVWEVAAEREVARMLHDGDIWSVAFSPDGEYVVTGGADKTAHVWEAATGQEVARVTHEDMVALVAFSPDGKYVVSGSWDDTVRIWEAVNGREVARVVHDNNISSIAFSPDGKYAASGSADNVVRVWELVTGTEVAHMSHDGTVTAIAFSADGRYAVSGSGDGLARVWELSSQKEVAHVTHAGTVTTVGFSPDGSHVVSGGEDYAAIVWESATGNEVIRMTHEDSVFFVAFTSDGSAILSTSANSARVWKWQLEDLVENICIMSPRNLTHAEWAQYVGDLLPYQAVCPNLPVDSAPMLTPTPVP